jgi:putative hemolysin
MPAIAIEIVIVALLILLNGALAMAEMAIVTARKARLEQRANAGDRKARAALDLANEPSQFLSTIQIGITLVGILAGAFGGATISQVIAAEVRSMPSLAPYADAIGLGVVVLTITYLTLIFGELAPKRLALNSPERIASIVAGPMRLLSRIVSPIAKLLSGSTELVLRILGVRHAQEAPVTEEEITLQIAKGRQAGVFEEAEQDIVEAVFRLGDRRVGSLMTPRPDVVWLDLDDPPEASVRTVLESHHLYYPVCRGELDNVVGLATARDLLARRAAGEPLDLSRIARPPLFVPERLHAFRLLERFKAQGAQFAVVVDEYGGTQGIVTLTDIFEAIVGEIPAAEEQAQPAVVQRDDGSWLVDGLFPLEELKEILAVDKLPGEETGDYYTVGGLMMSSLGRIPTAGDQFEWQGRRFEVMDMDGNRVDKVLVTPTRSERTG